MTRAISRESFDELKNYLGVYLQQGRPLLDADWNENQDIAVAALRQTNREAVGDGASDSGFALRRIFPASDTEQADFFTLSSILDVVFGSIRFFLIFPGQPLDDFETPGFELSSPQGNLRISGNRPYRGEGFLRLSGHAGTVRLRKRLTNLIDLTTFDLATFRYRRNRKNAPPFKFFVEDDNGKRTFFPVFDNPELPADTWLPGIVPSLDVGMHILTESLENMVLDTFPRIRLYVRGGVAPFTWSIVGGALPSGLVLEDDPTDERSIIITGQATPLGVFPFTLRVVDNQGRVATKALSLEMQAEGPVHGHTMPTEPEQRLIARAPFETPDGTPADLTKIRAYGFEVPQDPAAPLVWDFDDLRLGDRSAHEAVGANNFIISGSQRSTLDVDAALFGIFANDGFEPANPNRINAALVRDIVALLAANPDTSVPDARTSARLYVDGLSCLRFADTLYSQQADPNDPPLAAPAGQPRKDTVYVDAWTEPATYVDDPGIREVALGGPDTSTRTQVRHRVRVAQGGGLPAGDGRGSGMLATQGFYTAQANRLYLVEIDTPGDIGTATFRWSDENGSTIQRVVEAIPPGSLKVVVEDASAFQPGDLILLRKEFGVEEHQVASVVGNVIGLAHPTGDQLEDLPAASRVPGFTTFSLADRPMVQRWNAFRVPIPPDANEATTSATVPLNDGVTLRFGGHGMLAGDFWTFTARFLPGDGAAGVDPVTKVEKLNFQRPRGVVHHYAKLGTLLRDPVAGNPVDVIVDQRRRAGPATTTTTAAIGRIITGSVDLHVAGIPLPTTVPGSNLMLFFSASIARSPQVQNGRLTLSARFYNDDMTDPATDEFSGLLFEESRTIELTRLPPDADIPYQILFSGNKTSLIAFGETFVPTSVQIFADFSFTGGFTEISDINIVVLDLKNSMELTDEID